MSKKLTVVQIKKICKEKGIKGYSKMKKAELEKVCLGKSPVKKESVKKTKKTKKTKKGSPSVESLVKTLPKELKGIIKDMAVKPKKYKEPLRREMTPLRRILNEYVVSVPIEVAQQIKHDKSWQTYLANFKKVYDKENGMYLPLLPNTEETITVVINYMKKPEKYNTDFYDVADWSSVLETAKKRDKTAYEFLVNSFADYLGEYAREKKKLDAKKAKKAKKSKSS